MLWMHVAEVQVSACRAPDFDADTSYQEFNQVKLRYLILRYLLS